jgi:hypothetical protein
MKHLAFAFAAVCLFAASPAMAAEVAADGKVAIPWGDLLASSAGVLTSLAVTALAAGLAMLPPSINAVIKTWRVEQLLNNAIGYGINAVSGAARGQVLSVPIGNKVIEQAVEYAVQNGSAALVKWMGGQDAIKKKIVARVDLDPVASKATVG